MKIIMNSFLLILSISLIVYGMLSRNNFIQKMAERFDFTNSRAFKRNWSLQDDTETKRYARRSLISIFIGLFLLLAYILISQGFLNVLHEWLGFPFNYLEWHK